MERSAAAALRWPLADEDGGQPSLFASPEIGLRDLPHVEYLHVRARRIISDVPPGARLPFRHTINAYRGCTHACSYCFARPTHAYLGLGPGEDFERRIVVKVNAVERLRAELRATRWSGEAIAMGTNTDPYQPAEGRYRLTRGLLAVLVEHGNPFSILTKSPMVVRDIDLLAEGSERCDVSASLSIGTLDADVWRASEPGTPPPGRRVEALARLAAGGVACGVLIAPVLPWISDSRSQLDEVVAACLDAGARSVTPLLLHLRPGVRELFMPWLARERPDLVPLYRRLYAHRSGYARERQRALEATVAELVEGRLGARAARLGPRRHAAAPDVRPRTPGRQLSLLH